MAVETKDLVATVRTGTGKGAARQARRDGQVPGIVYGGGQEPVAINLPYNALLKQLKAGRFKQQILNLKVEGQGDVKVVCRAVERHVVKDLPTHVDLLRVTDSTRVNLFVDVEFANQDAAPGITKGGVLTVTNADVELSVLAGAIPASVSVDLTGKKIGDVITTADLILPEGVSVVADRAYAIASIIAPSGLVVGDDE